MANHVYDRKYVNGKPVSGMTGAYEYVYDIVEFMKRKRPTQCVILAPKALPLKCLVCHKPVTTAANRTDIKKVNGKIYVACMHYVCSWSSLLNKIFKELPRMA